MKPLQELVDYARELGFSHISKLNIKALIPRKEIRDMCQADMCQSFGRNWACPPVCVSLEEAQKRLSAFPQGILLQTTGNLADSFDMEGIHQYGKLHKKNFAALVRKAAYLDTNCLPLSAGPCTECIKCTYPNRPCRFPSKRLVSMEAYGLWVSDVCIQSGLQYNYGENTITYSSCILLHDI